jgi:tRNA 2-selenouridine synthase
MPHRQRDDLTEPQFKELFSSNIALMDVRAPIEFCAGSFPGATNRPLLDNQQRHVIGTEYAEH